MSYRGTEFAALSNYNLPFLLPYCTYISKKSFEILINWNQLLVTIIATWECKFFRKNWWRKRRRIERVFKTTTLSIYVKMKFITDSSPPPPIYVKLWCQNISSKWPKMPNNAGHIIMPRNLTLLLNNIGKVAEREMKKSLHMSYIYSEMHSDSHLLQKIFVVELLLPMTDISPAQK